MRHTNFHRITSASLIVIKIILTIFLVFCIHANNRFSVDLNSPSSEGSKGNVYRIAIDTIYDDLAMDQDFNNRMCTFYEALCKEKNGFFINAKNYEPIGNGHFAYSINTNDETVFISPYGRCVVVDHNYLRINPIRRVDGDLVEDALYSDENTLHVLVAESLKKDEDMIRENFLQWFYDYKIGVANMYHSELGQKIDTQSISELSVVLTFTANNQTYKTFNADIGDDNQVIIDPIAIVYNPSVDSSLVGGYITHSVYFIDDSQQGYDGIKAMIDIHNCPEIAAAIPIDSNLSSDNISDRLRMSLPQLTLLNLVVFLVMVIIFVRQKNFIGKPMHKIPSLNETYLLVLTLFLINSLSGIVVSLFTAQIIPIVIALVITSGESIIAIIVVKSINTSTNLKRLKDRS